MIKTRFRLIITGIFLIVFSAITFAAEPKETVIKDEIPTYKGGLDFILRGCFVIDSKSGPTKVGSDTRIIYKGRIKKGTSYDFQFYPNLLGKYPCYSTEMHDEALRQIKSHPHNYIDYEYISDEEIISNGFFSVSLKRAGTVDDKFNKFKKLRVYSFYCSYNDNYPKYKCKEEHIKAELILDLEPVDDLEASSPAVIDDAEYVGSSEKAGNDDAESTGEGFSDWLKRNWGWIAGIGGVAGAAGAGGAIAIAKSGGQTSKETEAETLPPPPPPATVPPAPQPIVPPPVAPTPPQPPAVVPPPPPAAVQSPPAPPQPAHQPKPELKPEPKPEPKPEQTIDSPKDNLTPEQKKYLEKIHEKYHINQDTSLEDTKKIVREIMEDNIKDGQEWTSEAKVWDGLTKGAQVTQCIADAGMSYATKAATASGLPGDVINGAYIFTKNLAGETTSAYLNSGDMSEAVQKASFNSMVEIGQNMVGNSGSWQQKLGANVFGDAAKAAYSAGLDDTKDTSDVLRDAAVGGAVGALRTGLEAGLGKLTETFAKPSANVKVDTFLDKTAQIDKWVQNGDISEKAGKMLTERATKALGSTMVDGKGAGDAINTFYKQTAEAQKLWDDRHVWEITSEHLKDLAKDRFVTSIASDQITGDIAGNTISNAFNTVTGETLFN